MQVRNDITELSERLKVVESEKLQLDAALADLRKEIENRKNETERERKRKEREEVRRRPPRPRRRRCPHTAMEARATSRAAFARVSDGGCRMRRTVACAP